MTRRGAGRETHHVHVTTLHRSSRCSLGGRAFRGRRLHFRHDLRLLRMDAARPALSIKYRKPDSAGD